MTGYRCRCGCKRPVTYTGKGRIPLATVCKRRLADLSPGEIDRIFAVAKAAIQARRGTRVDSQR